MILKSTIKIITKKRSNSSLFEWGYLVGSSLCSSKSKLKSQKQSIIILSTPPPF